MIVVVEGVSAAGKTTWCNNQNLGRVVPEQPPVDAGSFQNPTSVSFLVSQNVLRWQQALEAEQLTGVAVCDTDPFKLHYSWCEFRAGLRPESDWIAALSATRLAFANGGLGLADAVIFLNPPESTVRTQRDGDPTRTRRRFEKHLSFLPWLKEWYEAFDRLEPGRVYWEPVAELAKVEPRKVRSGTDVFDKFIDELVGSKRISPS